MENIPAILRNNRWRYFISVAAIIALVACSLFYIFPRLNLQNVVSTNTTKYHVSNTKESWMYLPKCAPINGIMKCKKGSGPRVETPFYELSVSYPDVLYRNSTGELILTVANINQEVIDSNTPAFLAEIKVLSKYFSFLPKNITDIALKEGNASILHFDAVSKKADGKRKILIESKMTQIPNNVASDGHWSQITVDVEVLPPSIIFGLSESALKVIQIISAGLGLPAILLFLLTFFANRWRDNQDEKSTSEKSRIILP